MTVTLHSNMKLVHVKYVCTFVGTVTLIQLTSSLTKFKKITGSCPWEGLIYLQTNLKSLLECAIFCNSNSIGPCTRLLWDNLNKKCFLHSEDQLPVIRLKTRNYWESYSRMRDVIGTFLLFYIFDATS